MKTIHQATALLAATLLAACGGSDNDDPPVTPPAATPQLKLSVTATEDFPGSYGSVGAYERLTGSISGEVDPKDPKNAVIQDLALAPVNARGMVEYSAEFVLLKPKDMAKAGGVLRYDAPNRGNILTMLNPTATPSDAVYLERGYVLLYSAWQGDVPKSSAARLTATVPVAKNADGSSITGPYRAELVPTAATPVMTLPGGVFNGTMIPYAPASLDNTQPGYSLTRRVNETDARQLVPASDWKFADCSATNAFPGTADGSKVCLKGGFDPKYLYELVYVAKDPKVMGVGLAALRDTVSFFRKATADSAGTANPLAGRITHAIGQGTSQSGNAMKTFLHLGFNQALDGGKVFDGMYAHVAARQTNINTRFAVPGGGGGLRTDHTAFGQTAPRGLAADYMDDVSGRQGGVMKRCTASNTCPRFFLGLSGTEFWQLQGSPVLTDAFGLRDLAQPDNARIYYYASTQHGGTGGTASIAYAPTRNVYPAGTVVHFTDTFRALFIALEDWVVRGTEPPASQVPRLADGTLARPDQLVFPAMKGLSWPVSGTATAIPDFSYLARYNGFPLLDFGPQYIAQDEAGIATLLPPYYTGRDYAILVPQVDPATGLTRAGIKSVEARAPLGTSIEFNYVATPGIVDLSNLTGSFIPFHTTEAARIAAGDTRPSLESLYGTQAGYVAAVTTAANQLVAERFLLQRDAELRIQQATATAVLP
ncbi:alpha/beta hydrolase domain-containing protein [Pseudorhodoferax sp.]|uniref:alpha/beta hydrolase domain-containing protein n=1 Tax=Pseudorhodoferax sp. TaxID=1993553 RepID=UPI002DD69BC7|nr:alpha/beta hydrolase domain-containing protein [Pseudorhodoferax sp.]